MSKNSTHVIKRQWTTDQLRQVFAYCQSDFDRFISLLVWLDGLK